MYEYQSAVNEGKKYDIVCSQIDKEEVSLRRVIGAKKDQYFLDKKMVTYVPFFSNLKTSEKFRLISK